MEAACPDGLEELVGPTGAWRGRAGAELHHHDPGLASALAAYLRFEGARNVVDMGCGLGAYVRAIRARGVGCEGFDGHAETARLTGDLCYTADFADASLPGALRDRGYDWCLCLEVFEHVPQVYEASLVDCMLAASQRGLVVSVATPGQGGVGHVNERPHGYVVELLEARGLVLDMLASVKLRRYCALPWFQENLLVFRRRRADLPEASRRPSCAACGAEGCRYRCARCQEVWYCSVECQCAAYGEHKVTCAMAADPPPAPAPGGSALTPPRAKAFDAAVSLGPNCLAAYRIAKAGFKRRSFPFDVVMTGTDGWPAREQGVWSAPVGLALVVECLLLQPPFRDYVADMAPLPHIQAVGNCGFTVDGGGCIPSAHCHDDPREQHVAATYGRRASRFLALLQSGYSVLFLYTVRLRDLRDASHVVGVARGLSAEVGRLVDAFAARWPALDYLLLLPVLGALHPSVPEDARQEMEAALRRLSSGQVRVERLDDAPAGADPMEGFWGDDAAWRRLFEAYPVKPRDFSEDCFAASTKRGCAKPASERRSESRDKFGRFVDSLVAIAPR